MKIYGLFLPYHKWDIYGYIESNELPDYPRSLRQIKLFDNASAQLNAYANTHCPASQMFTCEEEDYDKTVNDLHNKFDNKEWLEKHIEPYV